MVLFRCSRIFLPRKWILSNILDVYLRNIREEDNCHHFYRHSSKANYSMKKMSQIPEQLDHRSFQFPFDLLHGFRWIAIFWSQFYQDELHVLLNHLGKLSISYALTHSEQQTQLHLVHTENCFFQLNPNDCFAVKEQANNNIFQIIERKSVDILIKYLLIDFIKQIYREH